MYHGGIFQNGRELVPPRPHHCKNRIHPMRSAHIDRGSQDPLDECLHKDAGHKTCSEESPPLVSKKEDRHWSPRSEKPNCPNITDFDTSESLPHRHLSPSKYDPSNASNIASSPHPDRKANKPTYTTTRPSSAFAHAVQSYPR